MTEGSTTTTMAFRTDSFETCCSTVGFPADHVEVMEIHLMVSRFPYLSSFFMNLGGNYGSCHKRSPSY